MKKYIGALSVCILVLFTTNAHALGMATYEIIVTNTWSATTHPDAHPGIVNPHFSHLGGGTHNNTISFWDVGTLASPGMVQMAETGVVSGLASEFQTAIVGGSAKTSITQAVHVPAPGSYSFNFDIYESHSLFTLVSMLGPTPDWFVGVSGLDLHSGGGWVDGLDVTLYPYDGGTRDSVAFALFGLKEDPALPVSLIDSDPLRDRALGSFRFNLVSSTNSIPEPMSMMLFGTGLVGAALRRKFSA